MILNDPHDTKHAANCECIVCEAGRAKVEALFHVLANKAWIKREYLAMKSSEFTQVDLDGEIVLNAPRYVESGGVVWDNQEQEFLDSRRSDPFLRAAYEWWISEVTHELFLYDFSMYPVALNEQLGIEIL